MDITTIKDIAAIVAAITGIIALVKVVFKDSITFSGFLRKRITREVNEKNSAQDDSLKQINERINDIEVKYTELESTIKNVKVMAEAQGRLLLQEIHDGYKSKKAIPEKLYRIAEKTHRMYVEEFKDEGDVKRYWKDISEWDVLDGPIDVQDEKE